MLHGRLEFVRRKKLDRAQATFDGLGEGAPKTGAYTTEDFRQGVRQKAKKSGSAEVIAEYIAHCRSCPECLRIKTRTFKKIQEVRY